MRAINIYYLTRIHDHRGMSLLLEALSGRGDAKEVSAHEAATLWSFTDQMAALLAQGRCEGRDDWITFLDGFYFSYTIEHIGKEFDLLKFSSDSGCVLNIELKSVKVEEDRIRKQLDQNRYYLSHIASEIYSFTYVMETGELYTLDDSGAFEPCGMERLAGVLALDILREYLPEGIENCFRAAEYLICPIAEPDKFLKGKYFLTNQQFDFRKKILGFLQEQSSSEENVPVISISGIAGCGKTLLLMNLAAALSEEEPVLFIHSGTLRKGHMELNRALERVHFIGGKKAVNDRLPEGYGYVMIDEADHLAKADLEKIISFTRKNGIPLVMTYDPRRLLIDNEDGEGNAKLTETAELIERNSVLSLSFTGNIRTNRPVYAFLRSLLHLTEPASGMDYSCIDVLYAENRRERKIIERSYTEQGYILVSAGSRGGSENDLIAREYNRVIMHLDETYYYDDTMRLRVRENEEDALHLLYEGMSRTRERLCLVVCKNRNLFLKILSIRIGRRRGTRG